MIWKKWQFTHPRKTRGFILNLKESVYSVSQYYFSMALPTCAFQKCFNLNITWNCVLEFCVNYMQYQVHKFLRNWFFHLFFWHIVSILVLFSTKINFCHNHAKIMQPYLNRWMRHEMVLSPRPKVDISRPQKAFKIPPSGNTNERTIVWKWATLNAR